MKTVLFVAWLAFSRFRLVIPLRDRTAPSVFAALDRCFRVLGGAPTYVLTDNEKTVTTAHVAGVPVRNQQTLDFARHYGVTVLTCQPADPASKGGVEASVKLAKADLVPKDTNLCADYGSFAELEAACEAFMDEVNNREHRTIRRKPAAALAEEQSRQHRIPDAAPDPRCSAHGRVRAGPHGSGEHPDGHVRECSVFRSSASARVPGVCPHPWRRPR
nr:DDE-type integrase/transposase/recombinase [Paenarthrobacter nitroguajacolicus]